MYVSGSFLVTDYLPNNRVLQAPIEAYIDIKHNYVQRNVARYLLKKQNIKGKQINFK